MLVHLIQVHPLIGHFLQEVQLSPLGFAACQSKNCTNQVNHTFCLVGALLIMLVHFLLWQAAKPSGDKCTPYSYQSLYGCTSSCEL